MKGIKRNIASGVSGTLIGSLGGLIGLGGAEFRLPILIGVFRFSSLDAVIINKMSSLIVVLFSLPFRSASIPWHEVFSRYDVILNILSGSLLGAWLGAHYATKVKTSVLDRLIMLLLVGLAVMMIFGHNLLGSHASVLVENTVLRFALGTVAGLFIGAVAAVLGVAGGELIIPTLVLLFGVDVKIAGSLSLCISLPTMLVAFFRYTQSGALALLKTETKFLLCMAAGSILGTAIGGQLVGIIPSSVLVLVLGCILLISAVKIFHHQKKKQVQKSS